MPKSSETCQPSVETRSREPRPSAVHRQRHLARRSFLKAAALGATVGVVPTQLFSPEGIAFAGRRTASNEKAKKGISSRSLRMARCPVTGDSVSEEVAIDYKGGTLYFCNADCIDKFRADRTAYEAKANAQLVVTGQYKQIQCPLTGEEFAPRLKTKVCGVYVCFSSTDGLKKVKRASTDERTEMVFGEVFGRAFAIEEDDSSASTSPADKWQCVVCGYVHKGTTPPAKCPTCNAKSDSFVPMRDAS